MRVDRPKLFVMLLIAASLMTPIGWLLAQSTQPTPAVAAPKPRGVDHARLVTFDRYVYGQVQIVKSDQRIERTKVLAGDGDSGRGIAIVGSSEKTPVENTVIKDCVILANGDDGISVGSHTRRTRIENCLLTDIQAGNGARAKQTKAALFSPSANLPAPFDLQWLSVKDTTFNAFARAPEIRGGVARFLRCKFMPSARTIWTEARVNIVECDFYTRGKPADATWWDEGRPIVLKDPPADSIYVDVKTCTLDGRPIQSASELFRLWQPYVNGTVGNKDVPATVFRKKPWPTR